MAHVEINRIERLAWPQSRRSAAVQSEPLIRDIAPRPRRAVAFALCMVDGDDIYHEYVGFDHSVAFKLTTGCSTMSNAQMPFQIVVEAAAVKLAVAVSDRPAE